MWVVNTVLLTKGKVKKPRALWGKKKGDFLILPNLEKNAHFDNTKNRITEDNRKLLPVSFPSRKNLLEGFISLHI